MSSSAVTEALLGAPTIHRGFWYSQGVDDLPQGHMLTLDTFWFTAINLGLGVLVAWAVSTLWRIACAALFGIFYRDQLTWEESQNMALVVNSPSAIEGCLTSGELLIHRRKVPASPQRSRAKTTLIALALVGFLIAGLNLGFPVLAALIPTTNKGLAISQDCGFETTVSCGNVDEPCPATFKSAGKITQWANAALGLVDTNTGSQTRSATFPKITQSFIKRCPTSVSACSSEYPFTFSANYTLSQDHFSLNVDEPFSLSVSHTCYRAIDSTALLNTSSTAVPSVRFYYGPLAFSDGTHQEFTQSASLARWYSPRYALYPYSAVANERGGYWTPNSTLVMDGDTTILFYFIGGVVMTNQSSDPLFATDSDYDIGGVYYRHTYLVAPIVCDTKYGFCDGNGGCSDAGGLLKVMQWMEKKTVDEWKDLRYLFKQLFAISPIHLAASGSSSIKASQTANRGYFQFDSESITAFGELGRLASAGSLMIASVGQISGLGYWELGNASTGFDPQNSKSICKNVLMNSSKVNTIPVMPYSLLLAFLLLIVLLGKIQLWPRHRLPPAYRDLLDAWTLHLPGQLHREVTERIRGRFQKIDTTADWPTVETYHLGPAVVVCDNTKRFGSIGDDDKSSTEDMSRRSVLAISPSDFAPQYTSNNLRRERDASGHARWCSFDTSSELFQSFQSGGDVARLTPVSYHTREAGYITSHDLGDDSCKPQRSQSIMH